jgi:hypothetical protein
MNPCSMVLGEDRVDQESAGRIRHRLPSDAWDVSCEGDEGEGGGALLSEEASGAVLAAAVLDAAQAVPKDSSTRSVGYIYIIYPNAL